MTPPSPAEPSPAEPEFQAAFFSREEIWLAPGEAARFQLQRLLFRENALPPRPVRLQPLVLTISSLEQRLLAELPWPELDAPGYELLLYKLAEPGLLLNGPAEEAETAMRAALALSLGDGLSRLKLAGLSWERTASLPPRALSAALADIGRRHDAFLRDRGRLDRATKRLKLLEALKAGRAFKNLAGARKIIYHEAQRLSPFETEFLLALAAAREVELTLKTPAWAREEKISHGAGFDLLRAIRRLEESAAPGLNLEFVAQDDGRTPPPLAYAADFLLAPGLGRGTPAPDPDGRITITLTPTAYHEVEEAGRGLKKALLAGLAPEDLALVLPEDYVAMAEDVGRRFGLAFHFARGRPPAESGPARAVFNLLSVWGSHWERSRIMELIRCPYFQGLEEARLLAGLTIKAGVTDQRAGGGFEENLAKFLARNSGQAPAARALLGFVGRLKKAESDLAAAADWPVFLRIFQELLDELGWPGPPAAAAAAAAADQAEAELLRKNLADLARALTTVEIRPVSLPVFRLWLNHTLLTRRRTDSRGPEGRIWVLNYYDLHGARFEEIFFLGLNERVFPKTAPDSRWWPEELTRAARDLLGRPLWSDAADRYRQEEALLAGGLAQAGRRVRLFHHTFDEAGRPVPPSPLLTHLKALWPAEGGGSRLATEVTAWRSAPENLADAAGPDELLVGLARLDPADWPAWAPPRHAEALAALRGRRERWRALARSARPGPEAAAWWLLKSQPLYQGSPLLKPSFLAGFAACPLAFWFQEALRLGSEGEPMEEWPATEEGLFIHRVLEKFFRPRLGAEGGPPWPGRADREAAHAELQAIIDLEAGLAGRGPLGRPPLWPPRREALAAALFAWLDREMESPDVRPWLLEWSFGELGPVGLDPVGPPPWPLAVGPGEFIHFKGRADRLDRTERGLRALDYKLRDSPALRVEKGRYPPRAWPLLIYTLAAANHFNMPAEAFFEIMNPADGPARRPGLPSDDPAMDCASDLSFPRLAAGTWADIKAGLFRLAPDEEKNCEYCAFAALCPGVREADSDSRGDDSREAGENPCGP